MGTNLGFILAYLPQIGGQMKVTNKSFRNILRSLFSKHPKQWDQALPQVEFAYNDSCNRSKFFDQFQIMYGMHPRGIYELLYLGKIEIRSADVKDFVATM